MNINKRKVRINLFWKLSGAFLLIVVLAIGLMAFFTNLNTRSSFQSYLSQSNAVYADTVAANLSRYYSTNRSWSGIQSVLPDFQRTMSDRLIVTDSAGRIVGDTSDNLIGSIAAGQGLSGGVNIKVSGSTVGTVYLYSGQNGMMGGGMGNGRMLGSGNANNIVLSTAEQDFLNKVNYWLIITGIITMAAAIALGWFLAFQVVRPVRALLQGTRNITEGKLDYRVNIKSRDELGELSQTFNIMAENLEKNEQSRRRLTADIAHELRTPLTIIEGTVDGIIDGVFPPDAERLTSIKEQTALLTRLIADLRDISLAESGQLKLNIVPADLAEIISRKVSQIQPAATEKGIQITTDLNTNIEKVNIDPVRMEQVIYNLLTNAMKYTPSGGHVTVVLKKVDGGESPHLPGTGILITVSDTGIGIAPEHLAYIFERFYRVQDSCERAAGGTGLGLAIVKQLMEAHNGRVWVESEPGKGSRFSVWLPV
jgi:signal transduction histidine kinase